MLGSSIKDARDAKSDVQALIALLNKVKPFDAVYAKHGETFSSSLEQVQQTSDKARRERGERKALL